MAKVTRRELERAFNAVCLYMANADDCWGEIKCPIRDCVCCAKTKGAEKLPCDKRIEAHFLKLAKEKSK